MRKKGILSILAILLFMLTTLTFTTQSPAAQVTLAWDANTESDLAGYKLYYGTASRTYGAPLDVGIVTTFTLDNLVDGQIYFLPDHIPHPHQINNLRMIIPPPP